MQRSLLIGLLLLTACQAATPAPTATTVRLPPTPPPASVTATLTPSPTFTPEPPPRFFTEEFERAPAYWTTLYASGDPAKADLFHRDGKLVFELYEPNTWLYAISGAHEYEAVHLEARVESSRSEANAMGLVCHYSEQNGWYEFNLSSDGAYALLYGQWLAEGIARYTPIRSEASDRIARGSAVNELGLDCYEDIVQVYINGKIIRKVDVSRFGLAGGRVGIAAASFDDLPVILAFDWFKVNEP
ncbi:MAG: hypothetical protein ACOYYJ_01300 [Chloroflexota bacterium]